MREQYLRFSTILRKLIKSLPKATLTLEFWNLQFSRWKLSSRVITAEFCNLLKVSRPTLISFIDLITCPNLVKNFVKN
jgi:hypothetical protein